MMHGFRQKGREESSIVPSEMICDGCSSGRLRGDCAVRAAGHWYGRYPGNIRLV